MNSHKCSSVSEGRDKDVFVFLQILPVKFQQPSRAHQEITARSRIPGGGEIFPFRNCPQAKTPLYVGMCGPAEANGQHCAALHIDTNQPPPKPLCARAPSTRWRHEGLGRGHTWPLARVFALLGVDATSSCEVGTDWRLRWQGMRWREASSTCNLQHCHLPTERIHVRDNGQWRKGNRHCQLQAAIFLWRHALRLLPFTVRHFSQFPASFRKFFAIGFGVSSLCACWVPFACSVSAHHREATREVWLRHRNFFAISRNFPEIFRSRTGPSLIAIPPAPQWGLAVVAQNQLCDSSFLKGAL